MPYDAPIRLLVLDVNGVLYQYDRDHRVAALAVELGRSTHEVDDAVFASGLEDAADAGDLGPDEYLSAVGSRLGVAFDRDQWRRSLAGAVSPNTDVLDLLTPLRTRVSMATLSNNGLLVDEEFDSIYPRIVELGIDVHVAASFGDSKPARGVYLDVCEVHGVEPRLAAFVDDKARNVEGARRAGLRAHHYRDVTGLADFLTDVGLTN